MANSPGTPDRPLHSAATIGAESILIVDDTFVLRDRLAVAFQERGLRVETAGDYDSAVAIFSRNPTDLAVIDLRMPGRGGLELLRTIKRLRPETRVVILSGFGSIATAITAVRSGATNFLPKPADADEILTAFAKGDSPGEPPPPGAEYPTPSLARTEWEHIHRVLADCNGNISEASRRLGIHRRSLQRKLRKRAPEDPGEPTA